MIKKNYLPKFLKTYKVFYLFKIILLISNIFITMVIIEVNKNHNFYYFQT